MMAAVKSAEQVIVIQQFTTPIIGTPDNDSLPGSDQDDVIVGLQGNDTLQGFAGNDLLMGNAGEDSLLGDAGDDDLSSASGNDILNGGADTDSLNGGADADNMQGGSGNDSYVVDNGGDVVNEGTNQDPGDTVYSYIDYQLPAAIENLTLLGSENLVGIGNAETGNTIIGNSGNNVLQGRVPVDTQGENSGDIDHFAGGQGSDLYNVDDSSDTIFESSNQGFDTVQSYVSYALPDNVENLVFAGVGPAPGTFIVGVGNELDNVFQGNLGDNLFLGESGNDVFFGGSVFGENGGDDTYVGGTGNDQYVIYNPLQDHVVEEDASGVDLVWSYATDYTLTSNVENLILASTDDLGRAGINGTGNELGNFMQGNELNNTLTGLAGNDYLIGSQGDDALNGGTDNDTYLFNLGDGADTVTDEAGDLDTLRFTNSIQQDQIAMFFNQQNQLQFGNTVNATDQVTIENQSLATTSIERFDLQNGLFMDAGDTQRVFQAMQVYASQQGIALNSLDDVRSNPGLMNILNRGWRGGQSISQSGTVNGTVLVADLPFLPGTLSDDVLVGFNSAFYFGLAGNDLIMAGDQSDVINGGEGDDIMNGGGGDDNLFGEEGNDVLNGGAGVDTMVGGNGNDVYLVDRYSLIPFMEQDRDVVIEVPNAGVDTVESYVPYYELTANVENLVLKGDAGGLFFGGGNGAFGIGNDLDNLIIGSDRGNYLDGRGGSNTLQGGQGDDIYIVRSDGDTVIETAGQGEQDTVRSNITYTLVPNVENLFLEGVDSINGTGNTLNNVIVGNEGNNILSGDLGNDTLYGGRGEDILQGGLGDDVYGVQSNTTVVEEAAGEGIDTVATYLIDYTLTDNVENLVIKDPIEGPVPMTTGTGNAENNLLQGGIGANILNGEAGDDYLIGAQFTDTLNGGAGNDTYLFRLNDGADTVTDEEGTLDTMRFNNSIAQDNIVVFRDNNDPNSSLQVGYVDNTTDQITVIGQTADNTNIERFELQNGLFMDAEDMNKVVSAMTQYAENNGVTFDSLQSVRDNADLISIVNGGWHA
jgi:Ca2+-binding RTX toxin-like protein